MAIDKKNKTTYNNPSNQNKNKRTGYAFTESNTPLMYLVPFIFVLAAIPLIVRYKSYENNLQNEYWHSASPISADIFLYYKSGFLIAFGVLLLFLLITALVIQTKKFKFEIEYAPLTVYLVFVLLSTALSQNIYFSINGIENHFESMWVLLAYVVLAFYGAIVIDNTAAIKIVIYGLLIGTWILMLIGVFQAFRLDIFTTEFFKHIVLPSNMQDHSLTLNFELGQVYITLYNPNYVGYFASITIPIFLTLAIYAKEYWKKALFAVTVIGVFICAIGSGAKNGLVALIAVALFMIIMFRRQLLKRWYIPIITVLALVAVFLGINALRHNAMIDSIKSSLNILFKKTETTRHLDGISCKNDCIDIAYDGKLYKLSMQVDNSGTIGVYMLDTSGNMVSTKHSEDGQSIVSDDKSFPFTLTPLNYSMDENTVVPSVQLTIDGYSYSFTNQLMNVYGNSPGYYYLNASGKWVAMGPAETSIFTNNPKLFSNRGYIWARTIPLLKKYLFVGSGPDTFSFVFPNYDYANAAYVGFLNQIVTKPHSLYLQIGVQTGVISLLAFIVFFMIYFVRSIILFWKHPLDTTLSKLGIGIAAGMLGYMVSGITNDSTITYAPVFWGLMGIGIALNRIVRKELAARPKTAEQ